MLYELAERPRILLIGADGQLGWELRRTASPLGDVIATVENDSRRRNVSADCSISRTTEPSAASSQR